MNEVVALFTRAWIEMTEELYDNGGICVALFTRAWIEISCNIFCTCLIICRPLHEGVD